MDSILGLVRHSGNDGLFKAIEMSLLATASGQPLHLHAEGLRGTGKTTVMRAAKRVLPRIRRIRDCLYNCDPVAPHCPQHRLLPDCEVAALGDEWVPMPFLEISHSAKVGTVVGSINLTRLVNPTQPEAALLPGTIPQAHRGIIFVDEINRLAETAPELADILLDVMGTKPGRVQIEETGLPAVELPVQVTVWAASNPDEDPGPLEEIRRQLSDRFDFAVYTDRPGDAAVVEQILDEAGGAAWHRPLTAADEARADHYRTQLSARVTALRTIGVPRPLRQAVADVYSRFNVESLRAVQAIQLGMRLAACMEARGEAESEDLARIAPLALRHRVDQETIKKVSAHLASLGPRQEASPVPVVARQRFSGISFGGAAVEAQSEARAPQPVPQADKPDAFSQQSASAARQWASQYPPVPQQADRGPGWFSRTLSGLRRNLGMGLAEPAMRPESRSEASQSYARAQERALAPRPGRLFQQAEQMSDRQGPPGNSGGLRQSAGGNSGAGRQGAISNPLETPPQAPPNAARPISSLQPHELIRTEEELGRR